MERRCFTCVSKFHFKRQCPDNRGGPRDEEKKTSRKASVSDSTGTMRERLSLKPTLKPSLKPALRPTLKPSSVAGDTMVDGHVSTFTLSPVECCCSS